ncbi:WXG100 family type VII secretion target [Streptomyces viridosporus]|uniref:WXG100 family type VII secretion target n=1 Tax=Streptomyces viridosporus TaxID=67581 RepID=UPI0009BF18FC|nr:WXG100 family type VII secretion target [Streptomyces viridosporus]
MGAQGAGAGQEGGVDLAVSSRDLTKLADDLDDMQDHLNKQVKRMDAIVDSIEAGWRGPAATAYREFHRAAAEDAVRIREVIRHLEQAVRLSRDGFTEQELEVVARRRGRTARPAAAACSSSRWTPTIRSPGTSRAA